MTTTSEAYRVSLSLEKDLLDNATGPRPQIRSSRDIVSVFSELGQLRREVMIAGALDCKCRMIHYSLIGVGASDHLLVRPGDAFHGASKSLATGIFLVHNHPSGSGAPSPEDFRITERIAAAGLILGFALFDHAIIAAEECTSLLNPITLQDFGHTVAKSRIVGRSGGHGVQWNCPHCECRCQETTLSIELALRRGTCVPLNCDGCKKLTWVHENRGGPQTVRSRGKIVAPSATLGMVAEQ